MGEQPTWELTLRLVMFSNDFKHMNPPKSDIWILLLKNLSYNKKDTSKKTIRWPFPNSKVDVATTIWSNLESVKHFLATSNLKLVKSPKKHNTL